MAARIVLFIGLLLVLYPQAWAVISGLKLKLVRAMVPDDAQRSRILGGISYNLGGMGYLYNDINSDLGGIGSGTNIDYLDTVGYSNINYGLDHINTRVQTSLGAKEVMNMREMDMNLANTEMEDLRSDIKEIGTLGSLGRGRTMRFTHPETSFPAITGMTKLPVINMTINFDNTCPLPFGSEFRLTDGSCGHPKNLGAAFKQISRLLPPLFEDGIQHPRITGVSGRLLPSPRLVSKTIHTDVDRASQFTIMLMQWGQFMDHDMVSTPLPVEDTRNSITCCGPNKTLPLGDEDPECFPILFPGDDSFLGQCMEFVRSMPMMDGFGDIVLPRENMNAVTSFVDASVVYGSSDDVQRELRTNSGSGAMFKLHNGRPVDNGLEDCIKRNGTDDICYLAGDERVNEHAGLTALHTVFMRKHNQWAATMRRMVPWMTDERVFQKVRAMVGAIVQKVMYNEWLPLILGQETVITSKIFSPPGQTSHFDENYNPSIFNAFSTAVFRFGHTLIPKELFLGDPRGQRTLFRDLFFKPYLLFEHFDDIATNLVVGHGPEDKSQIFDRHITEEVTNHLFETQEGMFKGFDLISLNLQRGRDHGIPPYNDYRELCGFHRVKSFDDPVLGTAGPLLAKVYEHPDDIELFTGGISEPTGYKGGIVGQTFNCLITKQMEALKFGDRYFFTHDRGSHGFTPRQLEQIHKYTLSHLMCETTGMPQVQRNSFIRPGQDNDMVDCAEMRRSSLDLIPFAYGL